MVAIFIAPMKTIDANGALINSALVAEALKDLGPAGIAPKWAKTHSAQLKAWLQHCSAAGEVAIGIGGVSVMLDDSLPATTIEFLDSQTTLTTHSVDGTELPAHKRMGKTAWKQLSEIINLGVPA